MILVITAKRITGLQYHRQIVPFKFLENDFKIEYRESEEGLTEEYLKNFTIISFLREIYGDVNWYKQLGLKIHFDIDDYWVLPSHHQLAKPYKENKYAEKTIAAITAADFVTTTTDYLAERIRKFNPNVYVLPNAIDSKEEQWVSNNTFDSSRYVSTSTGAIEYNYSIVKSDKRLKFGYIAGAHHVRDVEMLYPELLKLYRDHTIKNKWQLLTAGFNWNKDEAGRISANVYYRYVEQCFTNGYKELDLQYAQILASEKPMVFENVDEPYMRLNGKDINNYGKLYDQIDVALVPLINTEFNRNKSQLKIIEAGFKKKACMVSNVIPYVFDITSDNAIICNDGDWHKSIKYLINNPSKVTELQEAMYDYVKSKYEIRIVTINRKQLFEHYGN